MSDYLRTISKVSCKNSKEIKIPETVLQYYHWFNRLGENTNIQMHIKSHDKALILLGNFKMSYDTKNPFFNHIIFTSPNLKITVYGSFRKIDNKIVFHKHRRLEYYTYDLNTESVN